MKFMLKNKYATYISLICALTLGCQQKKSDDRPLDGLSFDTLKSDTTIYLFNDSSYPKCRIDISMEYVALAPNVEVKNLIDRFIIQSTLGEEYDTLSIENAVNQYIDEYIEEYKTLETDLKDGDQSLLVGASYNYDNIIESKLSYIDQNLLCLSNNSYLYTGGAHGMSSQYNFVFDQRDNKIVSLNNIFEESSYTDLGNIIVGQLTTDKGYRDSSKLYDDGFFSIDEIFPTENFSISTDGITWVYNPYEIAAYSAGQTSVFIPWFKVAKYTIADSPVDYLIEKD